MGKYITFTDEEQLKDFTSEHCRRLHNWFDEDGDFVAPYPAPGTREQLWHCLSLFRSKNKHSVNLARKIILKTPLDENQFTPIAAAEILLRFDNRLNTTVRNHLKSLMSEHFVNMIDIRFSNSSLNNFSSMTTFLLLAASQILEGYNWRHPLAGIPEIYNRHRIHNQGLNALKLLTYEIEHSDVAGEWHSPTYSPITLHGMACVAELIDNPETRKMALQVELWLWREILSLYHPRLDLSCGPYSRSYRGDVLGQRSNLRALLCRLGLSKYSSLAELLTLDYQNLKQPHQGNLPFLWAQNAWTAGGAYHLPVKMLNSLKKRKYPHRFESTITWGPYGAIDRKKRKFLPVQGDLWPQTKGKIVQIQGENFAMGYRSNYYFRHNCFPVYFHYAVEPKIKTLRDVRSVVGGIMFFGSQDEWSEGPDGIKVEADNFTHTGNVVVTEKNKALVFNASCLPEFANMPVSEISINTFIPVHFGSVHEIFLNGRKYSGSPIEQSGNQALYHIKDGDFEYEIIYFFPFPVKLNLFKWSHFIRLSGYWYQGAKRKFSKRELLSFTAKGHFKFCLKRGLFFSKQDL